MRTRFTALVATAAALALALTAQAAPSPNAGAEPIAGDATFEAFHGEAGLHRIVDDYIVRLTTDPRLSRRFEGADTDHLKLMLFDQFCYLTGGPCAYGGKSMEEAHRAMGIKDADFNALAEDLQLSMDQEKVPFREQNKLMAKLAPMRRVIVTRPGVL